MKSTVWENVSTGEPQSLKNQPAALKNCISCKNVIELSQCHNAGADGCAQNRWSINTH